MADRYDRQSFHLSREHFPYRRALFYLAGFALLLRLFVGASYVHSYDVEWNIMWGVELKDGFFSAYAHVRELDYPPLYLYPLYFVGRVVSLPSVYGYPPLRMLAIKLIPCLCDSLTCVVLFAVARKKDQLLGLLAAALWAVNPAAIFNCACWGQTDCVLLCMAALLMLSLQEKHVTAAGVLWAAMCSTKLQGLYLTPVVGMEVLTICFGSLHPREFSFSRVTNSQVMRFARFVLSALLTLLLIYLPFMIGAGGSHYYSDLGFWKKYFLPVTVYSEGVAKYPYCSLNGDNIYTLFGLNGIKDEIQVLTGLSVATIGKIFLLLSIAGVVAVYLFGKRRAHWLAGFMFMECVFMLTCRQHERYQMLALLLLIGAFLQLADRRLLSLFPLLSLVVFFNQFRILSGFREGSGWWKFYAYHDGSALWMNERRHFAFVNSLLNLLLFLAAAVFVVRYFFDEAPEVPALARLRRRISNWRALSDTRRGDSTSV